LLVVAISSIKYRALAPLYEPIYNILAGFIFGRSKSQTPLAAAPNQLAVELQAPGVIVMKTF
jgi:hypothetical protein